MDASPTVASPSLLLVRSDQCTRACQDMVVSAGIASFSGALIGVLGLVSPQGACFFVVGSIVAYGLAIHRILALRTCRRNDSEVARVER